VREFDIPPKIGYINNRRVTIRHIPGHVARSGTVCTTSCMVFRTLLSVCTTPVVGVDGCMVRRSPTLQAGVSSMHAGMMGEGGV